MLKSKTKGDVVFTCINTTLLTLIFIIILYPLIFVVSASFSEPMEVMKGNVILFPKGFSLDAYARVFRDNSIMIGYANTIMYTFFGTFLNVALTLLAAYPLSRRDFRGAKLITILMTITMFFGGGMIPTYLTYQKLGLVGKPLVLVLRGAVSVWNIIITRTFLEGVPYSLQEAAFVDGCSDFNVFRKIIVPLSRPIIVTMVLFYGVFHWNDFMGALIYIDNEKYYPLQLVLRNIMLQGEMESFTDSTSESLAQQQMLIEGIRYAVIVVASAPVIALYPFLQKHFVQGMTVGAVKG